MVKIAYFDFDMALRVQYTPHIKLTSTEESFFFSCFFPKKHPYSAVSDFFLQTGRELINMHYHLKFLGFCLDAKQIDYILNKIFVLCGQCSTSLVLCDSCSFSKGRTYEYDERDPAALLWERGVIPEHEGEYRKVLALN